MKLLFLSLVVLLLLACLLQPINAFKKGSDFIEKKAAEKIQQAMNAIPENLKKRERNVDVKKQGTLL